MVVVVGAGGWTPARQWQSLVVVVVVVVVGAAGLRPAHCGRPVNANRFRTLRDYAGIGPAV